MKVILKHFLAFIFLSAVVSFTACNDTDDGHFVEPITLFEKIQGEWIVKSVKQIDEIAKTNAQSPSEMTLTNQFDLSTFTIKLNVDNNNQPTSYEVGGTAPAFFPTSGFWSLDYPFPNTDASATVMILYSDASKTKETGTLTVTATPGATDVLELKFTRKTKGADFVSYVYNLSSKI